MSDSKISHQFDAKLAANYGIPAALIYNYIEYRCRHIPSHFVPLTLRDLCAQYPYLGRKQVRLALQRLTHPGRKRTALLDRTYDAADGYSYSPRGSYVLDEFPHTFDTALAAEIGIIPAIIYSNVSYWIKQNWQQGADEVSHELDPADFDFDLIRMEIFAYAQAKPRARHHGTIRKWAELHPYVPLRTAERGFARLIERGMLRVAHVSRKKSVWRLPAKSLSDYLRNTLNKCDLLNDTAKRAIVPPKGHGYRQKGINTAKRATKHDLKSEI